MSETAFAKPESQDQLLEKTSQKARNISGLKKYLGKTNLNIDLDSLRGRKDPR